MPDMFHITFTIMDAKAQKGRLLYHGAVSSFERTLDADPLVVVQDYARYLAQQLDRFITGAIVDISILIKPQLPTGIKVAPLLGSDCEEQLDCKFPATASSGGYQNRIPTFDHAIFGYGQTTLENTDWDDFWRPLVEIDAPGWNNNNGGISDAHGVEVHSEPIATKAFRRST